MCFDSTKAKTEIKGNQEKFFTLFYSQIGHDHKSKNPLCGFHKWSSEAPPN